MSDYDRYGLSYARNESGIPVSVFDGMMFRPYDERLDRWKMEQPKERNFPAVEQARQVLELFDELRASEKENSTLRQELEDLRKHAAACRLYVPKSAVLQEDVK